MVELKNCAKIEIATHCFDEDLSFRIRNRRNRLLGLWSATRLGIAGEAANAYAKKVVAKGIDHPGDEIVVRFIVGSRGPTGLVVAEEAIRAEMDHLSQIAAMEFAATELPSQPRAA